MMSGGGSDGVSADGRYTVTTRCGSDDVVVGDLFVARDRGVFRYSGDWLRHPDAYELAPSLPMTGGNQPLDGLGPFGDSAPDRWGRKLMLRRYRRTRLPEFAFLLGVSDASRQGALRFRDGSGTALSSHETEIPPERDLPDLLTIADAVAEGREDVTDVDARRLFRATGSLGGARPKANVTVGTGESAGLYMAKFPKPDGDDWDVIGWEAVCLDLQQEVGITVPDHRLLPIEGRNVLLVRRFDRAGGGDRRIPYLSAMSALEARDGDGGDWLDLVDVAQIHGADTGEMWRRTAFGVLIGNTDDHLRNHGFLRIGRTWEVAPAFDVNPTPLDARDEHQMTLFGSGALTLADVLTDDALALFGVSRRAASAWCTRAAVVLAGALERARRAGLSDRDVAVMESRFADAVAQAGTATGS